MCWILPFTIILGNRNLLDNYVEGEFFLRCTKALVKTRNYRFLQLITSVCLSQGKAISSNQNEICRILNEDTALQKLMLPSLSRKSNAICINFDGTRLAGKEGGTGSRAKWLGSGPIEISLFCKAASAEDSAYFESMLDFMASICQDRFYKGIRLLEDLYPFDLLLSGIENKDIPTKIRSKFVRLMDVLVVDRTPQEPLDFINYARVWKDETDTKKKHRPKHRSRASMLSLSGHITASQRMHITAYIRSFLESYEVPVEYGELAKLQHSQNMLTYNMLRLCRKLVVFGFYTSRDDLRGLIKALFPILTGNQDFNGSDSGIYILSTPNLHPSSPIYPTD